MHEPTLIPDSYTRVSMIQGRENSSTYAGNGSEIKKGLFFLFFFTFFFFLFLVFSPAFHHFYGGYLSDKSHCVSSLPGIPSKPGYNRYSLSGSTYMFGKGNHSGYAGARELSRA